MIWMQTCLYLFLLSSHGSVTAFICADYIWTAEYSCYYREQKVCEVITTSKHCSWKWSANEFKCPSELK